MKLFRSVVFITVCCLLLAAGAQDNQSSIPFRTAIELALKNSAASGIATADLQRARAGYTRSRDLFLPQAAVGSGLAYTNGFPLSLEGSAPAVFNVNVQEFLFNPAQYQYIKEAKTAINEAASQNDSRRNDVIMETALCYIQLDVVESTLAIEKEQQEMTASLTDIVSQRMQAGLDSQVEMTRARLADTRTRLLLGQAQSAADQLRQRLSQLTGLPASDIHTSTESIPHLPDVSQNDDLARQAAENNPLVKVAEQAAESKEFHAKAEKRQLYPTVDLVAQYAVLARYNNYDQFFNKNTFQRNNLTIGAVIRVPFFNPAQRAAASAAQADADKAKQEARSMKEQVSGETLKLQRSVRDLAAAREVCKLEHQLSQSDIETAHARIESGAATLKDEQSAKIVAQQRYTAYLDSSFQVDKAQVQLLRQTGELENWALGPAKK
jgi:outer membrane protein TolC